MPTLRHHTTAIGSILQGQNLRHENHLNRQWRKILAGLFSRWFNSVQTMNNSPDSSVIPSVWPKVFVGLGVVADSRPFRHDGATDLSLLLEISTLGN